MLDVILGLMGAAGFVAGLVIICNLAPRFVPKAQSATLGYLAEAKLQTLDGKETLFTVGVSIVFQINLKSRSQIVSII